jgi:hypothetical protein
MGTKKSLVDEYLGWILKRYHELQEYKQNQESYRIVDILKDKAGHYTLQIQLSGKSTFFACTPLEVVTNDKLLEGFSKKDIRTITYLATRTVKQPKYKIIIQEFCEKLNKMIFKLKKDDVTEEPIEKTADQISLDSDLLNKLNPADAHLVGYTTASEQASKDKLEMEQLKHNRIIEGKRNITDL